MFLSISTHRAALRQCVGTAGYRADDVVARHRGVGHNGGVQGSVSQTTATAGGDHLLSLNLNGGRNVHEQRIVNGEFRGA